MHSTAGTPQKRPNTASMQALSSHWTPSKGMVVGSALVKKEKDNGVHACSLRSLPGKGDIGEVVKPWDVALFDALILEME